MLYSARAQLSGEGRARVKNIERRRVDGGIFENLVREADGQKRHACRSGHERSLVRRTERNLCNENRERRARAYQPDRCGGGQKHSDGWWVEGYREGAGWALPQKRTYQNQEYQDQLDAATIYSLLENEIIPMYYNKNEEGYSEQWLDVVKKSVATIAPHYTMKRQLDDYYDKFYEKQAARFTELAAEDAKLAKEIAHWKETVAERWDAIHVVSKDTEFLTNGGETGVEYRMKYVIDEQGLEDAVGLELVTLKPLPDDEGRELYRVRPFEMTGHEGNQYTFEAVIDPDDAGTFKSCVRMFPKHKNLPHRQDFNYVKWLD